MFTGTRMKSRMILAIGLLAAGTHAFGPAGIALAAGANGTASAVVAVPELIEVMRGLGSAPDTFISPQAPGVPFHEIAIELSEPVVLDDSSTATTAGPAMAPLVLGLRDDGAGMHTVMLSDPVPPGHWVLVTLDVTSPVTGATARIRFGVAHLPDDIDQTGVVDVRDATEFGREFRDRQAAALVDLNGDGQVDVRDATEFGRLWRGDAFSAGWSGIALPPPHEATTGVAEATELPPIEEYAESMQLEAVGALLVTAELYDALNALEPGMPIDLLRDVPGYDLFIAAFGNEPVLADAAISTAPALVAAATVGSDGGNLTFSTNESGNADDAFGFSTDAQLETHLDGEGSASDDGLFVSPDDDIRFAGDDTGLSSASDADGLVKDDNGSTDGDGVFSRQDEDADGVRDDDASNPADNEREEADCLCEWIVTMTVDPEQVQEPDQEGRLWNNTTGIFVGPAGDYNSTFTTTLTAGVDGFFVRNGAGPTHEMKVRRDHGTCVSPKTTYSKFAYGEYTARLNVICKSGGTICDPGPCKSTVYGFGFYESNVGIGTVALECKGSSDIEAIAQDQTRFTIDNTAVFNRAVAVQNGNNVSTTISYEYGGELGVSSKDGVSVGVSASFGRSQTTSGRTGVASDALVASGEGQDDAPTTLRLWAKGNVQLNAARASAGWGRTATEIWGVVYVGVSSCPGAGTTFGGMLHGVPDRLRAKMKNAGNFIEQHSGTRPLWK